ncbi:MAG: hypothetical protein B7Z80_10340 [Rhodospirillales bacterium 20-64-7]|nr:MAG: hypothetical protein B7Z80_10340 [Rhodospirillales bacterium 20-64-7]
MNEPTVLELDDGRKLTIKQPDILQETRIVRAMGDSAANAVYMSAYVLPAAFVVAIDDDQVIFPRTEREIEGLIQRLGRDGIAAVRKHLVDTAAPTSEADLKN